MTAIPTRHDNMLHVTIQTSVKENAPIVSPGAFSSVFEEETRKNAREHSEMSAGTTDAGSHEQRRRQYGLPGALRGLLKETAVNSVENLSENCQDADGSCFSDGENTEQRCRKDSAQNRRDGQAKSRREDTKSITNDRNHLLISNHTLVQNINMSTLSSAAGAGLGVPPEQMKKLVRVLRNTSLSKRTSVFLTLDLEQMGEVKLDVTLKAKKLCITAYISDRRAAAALSYAISELKKQLAAIDLTLEHFEIKPGYQADSAHSNTTGVSASVAIH